jgi:mannose-6-phosphate isomerase-like protein (cupin superfamily)
VAEPTTPARWSAYEVEAMRRRASGERAYAEFLRVPAMSAGIYRLPAGAADPQRPHGEEELYYVIAGRAVLRVDGDDRPVAPGSIVYVAAGVPHRFHSIAEALEVLVLFAPAESDT